MFMYEAEDMTHLMSYVSDPILICKRTCSDSQAVAIRIRKTRVRGLMLAS
jgi:hypothetical protein